MIMNAHCAKCLMDKWLEATPAEAAPPLRAAYEGQVRALIEGNRTLSSPEMDSALIDIYTAHFGPGVDYGPIKRRFNALMLALLPEMRADIESAADPLERAVQYAMTGNFIDFAAMSDVDEDKLRGLLKAAGDVPVDARALAALRREALRARRLLFMTDNCGEIVTDRALIEVLGRLNPDMEITVMVRGAPVVNDATLEDAEQVGMAETAHRIVGSGCGIAGNPLNRISDEARRAIDAADVMISKGQANYEALNGCGLNMFFIFMCKCQLFMDRFHVPRFAGMLTQEDF